MAGQRNRPVPIALVTAQAEAARAKGLGVAFFYFETLWQRSEEPAALRQEALERLFPTPAPRRLTRTPPSGPPPPPPAQDGVTTAAPADGLPRQRPPGRVDRRRQRPARGDRRTAGGGGQLRHGHGETGLWRLDDAPAGPLEGRAARACDPAGAAVQLHERQERHRFSPDHRCHGPAARRAAGWFLPGVLRQRLHAAGHPLAGGGPGRVWLRRAQDAQAVRGDKFIYTEILKRAETAGAEAAAPGAALKQLGPALRSAIAAVDQEDGWAPLGQVGTWLLKHDPSFDPRNFGFKKLSDLVRAQSDLNLKTVPGNQGAHLYVRVG